MRAVQEGKTSGGSALGSLMIAWIIVVGLAIVPVAMWAKQHDDIILLIAFCGAALMIGLALFVATGLARMGARSRVKGGDGHIANLNRRGAVFGKR